MGEEFHQAFVIDAIVIHVSFLGHHVHSVRPRVCTYLNSEKSSVEEHEIWIVTQALPPFMRHAM
jgi:hypothetical protein